MKTFFSKNYCCWPQYVKLEGAGTLGVLPAGGVNHVPCLKAACGLCSDVECSAELNKNMEDQYLYHKHLQQRNQIFSSSGEIMGKSKVIVKYVVQLTSTQTY